MHSGAPGHGAIVIGQLAQHACRFKASQGHEVDSGFGVAAAGQYAAGCARSGKT